MAAVTKYVCDRCEAEQDVPEQMWDIRIHVSHYPGAQPRYYDHNAKEVALWCRKCCDELGLVNKIIVAEGSQATVPTFEDLIRAICEDVLRKQE